MPQPVPYVVADAPTVELDFNDAANVVAWFVAAGKLQRQHAAWFIDVTPPNTSYRVWKAFTCEAAATVAISEDMGWLLPRDAYFRRACQELCLPPALAVSYSLVQRVAQAVQSVNAVSADVWKDAPVVAGRVWKHLLNKYILDFWMSCEGMAVDMSGVLRIISMVVQLYAVDAEAQAIIVCGITGEPHPDRSCLNPNAPPFRPIATNASSCVDGLAQPQPLRRQLTYAPSESQESVPSAASPSQPLAAAGAGREPPFACTSPRTLHVRRTGPPTGSDGEWFFETSTNLLYGPRGDGVWPVRSVVCASRTSAHDQSDTVMLIRQRAPQAYEFPHIGSYYLDASSWCLFGPRTEDGWNALPPLRPSARIPLRAGQPHVACLPFSKGARAPVQL